MKRIATIVVAAMMFLGAGAVSVPAVAAPYPAGVTAMDQIGPNGTVECIRGYACVWRERDYQYQGFGTTDSMRLDEVYYPNNNSRSAKANGGSCSRTQFYDAASYEIDVSHRFVLYSKTLVGYNYQDPYLANGAGQDAQYSQNWNDRVSAILFRNC